MKCFASFKILLSIYLYHLCKPAVQPFPKDLIPATDSDRIVFTAPADGIFQLKITSGSYEL